MGILYGAGATNTYAALRAAFTGVTAYSFLIFNLLCAPCFAAIGAIKREMNNRKWTWFAIGYQCGFAYAVSLCIYQIGSLFNGSFASGSAATTVGHVFGLIVSLALLAGAVYMLFFRKYKEADKLERSVSVSK